MPGNRPGDGEMGITGDAPGDGEMCITDADQGKSFANVKLLSLNVSRDDSSFEIA